MFLPLFSPSSLSPLSSLLSPLFSPLSSPSFSLLPSSLSSLLPRSLLISRFWTGRLLGEFCRIHEGSSCDLARFLHLHAGETLCAGMHSLRPTCVSTSVTTQGRKHTVFHCVSRPYHHVWSTVMFYPCEVHPRVSYWRICIQRACVPPPPPSDKGSVIQTQ